MYMNIPIYVASANSAQCSRHSCGQPLRVWRAPEMLEMTATNQPSASQFISNTHPRRSSAG